MTSLLANVAHALLGLPRRLQSWGETVWSPCTCQKNSQEPFRAGRDMLGDLEPNHEHEQLKGPEQGKDLSKIP